MRCIADVSKEIQGSCMDSCAGWLLRAVIEDINFAREQHTFNHCFIGFQGCDSTFLFVPVE